MSPHRQFRSLRFIATVGVLFGALLAGSPAAAQEEGPKGFQLNRYEPTPAGSWFFGVDHPWYSKTRYFAGGITLNYGHNPLVFGYFDGDGNFQKNTAVVGNAFLGHVDLAGSFLDRVLISASLPITFVETGTAANGAAPVSGAAVGDPRLGIMVRLYGQHDYSRFGISLGAYLWAPIGMSAKNSGDSGVRFMPRLVVGGVSDYLRYSLNLGFLYRPEASVGLPQASGGNIVGSEFQIGAGLAYVNKDRSFHIGPELIFGTQVVGGRGGKYVGSSLEVMLGASYLIKKTVMVGIAPGIGALQQPGTPDFRLLARVAYAPIRPEDRDKDGIVDPKDACPDEPGVRQDDPKENGCPIRDRDQDGVLDKDDICPDVPKGEHPDPKRNGCPLDDRDGDLVFDFEDICPDVPKGDRPDARRLGCPLGDRDKDGVYDNEDLCPDVHKGEHPDPTRIGCPLGDRDGDGIYDDEDLCPDVHKGEHPDPKRLGCPAQDTDRDTVYDFEDVCPSVPYGPYPDPDPARKGCPLPDRDFDTVPDPMDACPDKPGPPHPDPKKNGCPGLVELKEGQIKILQPIFFATDRDVILPQSFPVLEAVADVMRARLDIKKVSVEGHTDNRGSRPHNIDLSDRRAKSVVRWLTGAGIDPSRLAGQGFGPDRPVANNATNAGRSLNRRVQFNITDPAPAAAKPGEDQIRMQNPQLVPEGMTAPDASERGGRVKRGKAGKKVKAGKAGKRSRK